MKTAELLEVSLGDSTPVSRMANELETELKLKYVYSSQPRRVWTRGDGRRYRDPAYLQFASAADAAAAMQHMLSKDHAEIILTGPFGSSRRPAVLVGGKVLIDAPGERRIYVYSKSTIERSPVMGIEHGESHLMRILIKAIANGKKVAINVKRGRSTVRGIITAATDRELTIDGGSKFAVPPLVDKLYTIRTIDGIPTFTNK